jgi:hypothetical protein
VRLITAVVIIDASWIYCGAANTTSVATGKVVDYKVNSHSCDLNKEQDKNVAAINNG